MMDLTIAAQGIITQVKQPWYIEYFWPILAWLIVPFVSFRIIQWVKHSFYLRTWMIDVLSFLLCGGLASACWYMKYPTSILGFILIGIMVASLQTIMIKILFTAIDKFSPKLADELADGIDLDNDEVTVVHKVKAVAIGKRKKRK